MPRWRLALLSAITSGPQSTKSFGRHPVPLAQLVVHDRGERGRVHLALARTDGPAGTRRGPRPGADRATFCVKCRTSGIDRPRARQDDDQHQGGPPALAEAGRRHRPYGYHGLERRGRHAGRAASDAAARRRARRGAGSTTTRRCCRRALHRLATAVRLTSTLAAGPLVEACRVPPSVIGDGGALLAGLEQPGAARAELVPELGEAGTEADAEREQRCAGDQQGVELAAAAAREGVESCHLIAKRRQLRCVDGEGGSRHRVVRWVQDACRAPRTGLGSATARPGTSHSRTLAALRAGRRRSTGLAYANPSAGSSRTPAAQNDTPALDSRSGHAPRPLLARRRAAGGNSAHAAPRRHCQVR